MRACFISRRVLLFERIFSPVKARIRRNPLWISHGLCKAGRVSGAFPFKPDKDAQRRSGGKFRRKDVREEI